MKKVLVCSAFLAIFCAVGFTGTCFASDKGPADLTLESTIDPAKKPKPAIFPHAKHQETLKCGDCHHSKDDAGKQVAYVEGQKIEKCESCHNSKAEMPKKLATFKGAAHANCKECHTKTAKADESKKALKKCTTCHPKKK